MRYNIVGSKTVEWLIEEGFLLVRFHGVGTKNQFDRVLVSFKERFPEAEWLLQKRAWKLALDHIQSLSMFAQEFFGSSSMIYSIRENSPVQQKLF